MQTAVEEPLHIQSTRDVIWHHSDVIGRCATRVPRLKSDASHTGPQGIQAALQLFMAWPPQGPTPQSTRGHAPFLLAAALLLLPLPQWEAARRETLLQTLHRSLPAAASPPPLAELQASALPALRLWGLVDWLQRALKRGAPTSPPTAWSARFDPLSPRVSILQFCLYFWNFKGLLLKM